MLMNQSKQDEEMEGFHWPSHGHTPLKELGRGISLSQASQTEGGGRMIPKKESSLLSTCYVPGIVLSFGEYHGE